MNDGTPEKLPSVLLLNVSQSPAVYCDNEAHIMRNIIEAHVFASERRQSAGICDIVDMVARRLGFTIIKRESSAQGKIRIDTMTLCRISPVLICI